MKNPLVIVLIVIAAAVGGLAGYFFGYDIGFEKAATNQTTKPINQAPQKFENEVVKVTSPTINQKITSPVMITGQAVGNWFFEASFPIEIIDTDGVVLGVGFVQAQSEWMTTDFVPFAGSIVFTPGAATSGFVVFKKDNPSGLPEHDDSRQMPVRFVD